jgi:hypothetical protein
MNDLNRIHKYQDKLLDNNFDPPDYKEKSNEDDLYDLWWDQAHDNDPEEDSDEE